MIQFNIMELKHALEIKNSRFYSNKEIANDSGLAPSTVNNLMRTNAVFFRIRTLSKFANYFQREGLTISVGDFFRWEGEDLVLNVGFLIVRLNPIPRHSLIARETDISLSRLRNLARGNVKQIYLDDLAALLKFFRKKGIEIKLGDLLREKKTISGFDENNYLGEETASIPDSKRRDVVLKRVKMNEEETGNIPDLKRHDFIPKPVKVNEEYDYLIRKQKPFVEGQQSKPNAYVPIIRPNLMMLKGILELKSGIDYFYRDISQEARVSYRAVENLIRGDATLFYLSTMGKLAYYFQREGLTIEVGDFFRWKGEELVLNIGSLMTQLDPTPLIKKVHNETGISLFRVEDLVRGNVKRIDLDDFGALLLFFRKRGLSIKLGDLLREEGVDPLPRMFSLSAEEKVRLAEERKALEISRNMVDIGMDVTQIATVTGLNPEQIKVLA